MRTYIKWGTISMFSWILFLILLFGGYLYFKNTPITYFVDEETGGFISAIFFTIWAFIWFGIGYHYSKDYYTKKTAYIAIEGIKNIIQFIAVR